MKSAKDLFSDQSLTYKKYRPTYPKNLYDLILSQVKAREACWDVGCGNGQVAVELSRHFEKVEATDLSKHQIAHAVRQSNINYQVGRAEKTNFPSEFFDLVTVAQAIHWFDHEAFNREVKRVLKPGGIFAFWCYSLLQVSEQIDDIISAFYTDKIGAFWDTERRYIDDHYRTIPFPFEEVYFNAAPILMKAKWSLQIMEGYLNSWSSVQRYIRVNKSNPVEAVMNKIRPFWEETLEVTFPIYLRIGVI